MPVLKTTDSDSPELKLYDLYVQRIMKHYELVLTQFNIYFGINVALMAAAGFLLGSDKLSITRDQLLQYLIPGMSMLGVAVSIAWFAVNRDGRRWQLLMNTVLERLETDIFETPSQHGLYTRINAQYAPTTRFGLDLIDLNLYVAIVFIIGWAVIGVAAPRFV